MIRGKVFLELARLLRDRRALRGCCAALIAGLGLAFRGRKNSRRPEWDKAGPERGLDRSLKKRLDAPNQGNRTFLGLARRSKLRGGREVCLGEESRERHMQIVGPTRSGKSQLLLALAAQDMRAGMPVFFMEAKGDESDFNQFRALAARAKRAGDIRYFNPQDPSSMSFNPIRRLPGQDATALANQISRVLGREPASSGEAQDYYKSADYAKIQNMAEVFWEINLQYTLKDCFYYFGFERCREKAFSLCSDKGLVKMSRRDFSQNTDTTALTSAIRPYATGALGRLLNTYSPQIKLDEIFSCRQLAYFAIPVGHLPVLANPLGRMLISGLNSVAAFRQRQNPKPGPASLILDEFSEFATPAFKSFIQTVGSARFWTTLSHQDLGQLKNVQGMDKDGFASSVFNNTSGCKICFRTPDPEDAEFWAQTLGTYPTCEDTERFQRSFLGTRGTGEISRRQVEHFKVHPNALKNLGPGRALVFSPGHEDCLIRSARVFNLLAKTPQAEMPLEDIPASREAGLELESEFNLLREKSAVNAQGVKA